MARVLRLASALALAVVLAGCGSGDEAAGPGTTGAPPPSTDTGAATDTSTEPATTEEPGETTVVAYFLRGETVYPVQRTVQEAEAVATAAVEELLAGPTGEERGYGLTTSIPEEARLLGLDVDDGTATVDLSSGFTAGGGTLSMTTRLAQLVFTLTRFPTIERVDVRIEGEDVEQIGGEGVPVEPPLTRDDFPEATPQILVEDPVLGESVTSPATVSGTASVFEATVLVRVLDAQGNVLGEEVATATEGAPGRGTFEVQVPFDVAEAQQGTIVAAAPNAAGGPPQHTFEVPVRLEPTG